MARPPKAPFCFLLSQSLLSPLPPSQHFSFSLVPPSTPNPQLLCNRIRLLLQRAATPNLWDREAGTRVSKVRTDTGTTPARTSRAGSGNRPQLQRAATAAPWNREAGTRVSIVKTDTGTSTVPSDLGPEFKLRLEQASYVVIVSLHRNEHRGAPGEVTPKVNRRQAGDS